MKVIILQFVQFLSCAIIITAVSSSERSYQNNALLSSVYDAMKGNVDRGQDYDARQRPRHSEDTPRRRRGFYESEQYNNKQQSEEWPAEPPYNNKKSSGELICNTEYANNHERQATIEISQQVTPYLSGFVRFVLSALGFLVLLKGLLIPLKILLGIKAAATANSFMLATLFYRYFNRRKRLGILGDRGRSDVDQLKDEHGKELGRILKQVSKSNKNW